MTTESDAYQPRPEHKFTFGLWTVGRRGGDPFGEPVRAERSPADLVKLLAEVAAWGDQDLRFASANPREGFWLVKFLEDVGYDGPRPFDAHAYRTSNDDGVREFAVGCMRNYLILKERARPWNQDERIRELKSAVNGETVLRPYSAERVSELRERQFDREKLAATPNPDEALDQRTLEILLNTG